MIGFIAQSAAQERLSWTMLYGALVIMGLLALAWIAVVWAKRRSASETDASPILPFTLHDLRRLREEGQLTDEEFEKARGRILAMSRAQLQEETQEKPASSPDHPEERAEG